MTLFTFAILGFNSSALTQNLDDEWSAIIRRTTSKARAQLIVRSVGGIDGGKGFSSSHVFNSTPIRQITIGIDIGHCLTQSWI